MRCDTGCLGLRFLGFCFLAAAATTLLRCRKTGDRAGVCLLLLLLSCVVNPHSNMTAGVAQAEGVTSLPCSAA